MAPVAGQPNLGFRELVCGFSEPKRSRRLLLMLAHIDGSGSMNDSPVYVMAGYIGSVAAWEKFTAEWQAALDEPKAIEYFKMREAWARRDQFDGWSLEARDARLKLLAPIANRHAIAAVLYVVSTDAWKRHFVGRLEKRYHDRPYFFAYHGIMSGVVRYLHAKGIQEKVDFIFDEEGGESLKLMQESFEGWKELAPKEFKPYIGRRPMPGNDKDVLPLQAADFFAWHIRRSFAEGLQGKNVDDLTVAASELFNIEQARSIWGEDEVKEAIDFVELRGWLLRIKGVDITLPDPSNPFPWPRS
jgi:hypothetical protein